MFIHTCSDNGLILVFALVSANEISISEFLFHHTFNLVHHLLIVELNSFIYSNEFYLKSPWLTVENPMQRLETGQNDALYREHIVFFTPWTFLKALILDCFQSLFRLLFQVHLIFFQLVAIGDISESYPLDTNTPLV